MRKFQALFLLAVSLLVSSNSVQAGFPDDFSDVTFIHRNISSWPVTAALNVSVSGGVINMPYDKATTWSSRNHPLCPGCNANPWVVVKFGDRWYAATFEWFRFGQTSKPIKVVHGDHIKQGPFGTTWTPKNGETYGFMVSSLARSTFPPFNEQERSNIVMYKWGVGVVEPEPEPETETPVITPQVNLLLN